jgi:hypothetical protein
MIAAETPRLAIATRPAPAASDSILARLAALLTRVADTQPSDDEAVWTSIARGL